MYAVDQSVLKAAQDEVVAENQKRAVKQVVGLLTNVEQCERISLNNLRRIRKQETATAESLKQLTRAKDYFSATGNPLPMLHHAGLNYAIADYCNALGVEVPDMRKNKEAYQVPEDWKKPA